MQKQKALEAIQAFTASLKPVVANSYAPLVAKILKIAEGSFWLTRGANTQAAQERMQAYEMQNFGKNQRGRKDILEIRFLKTMIENPNFKKIVLENLKTEYFVRHRDIYEAVAHGASADDPAVRELMFENYEAFKDEDEILKNIILIARNRGIKNIACEMGYDQRASMEMALKFNGFKSAFYKDLAGFDRGFCARLKL